MEFATDAAGLAWVNLCSRVTSRVVVRVASFTATGFPELEKQARRVSWERWLPEGALVQLSVVCRKSRLYHSGAVAERVAGVLEREVGAEWVKGAADADTDDGDGRIAGAAPLSGDSYSGTDSVRDVQRVLVRIFRDRVTISVDASGELLHRRGYRQAIAKAPLRETLAAALVQGSGWTGTTSLVDPFCGSGTVCIEAAMMARRIPPGRARTFALELWPEFRKEALISARERGEESISTAALPPIVGSDRDEGAIQAARANAERAGVSPDIDFTRKTISEVTAPVGEAGTLLTNPPYGVRVGEERALRDLYARLETVLRAEFQGWKVGLLVPQRGLIDQLRLGHEWRIDTNNGGIRVGLAIATVSARGRAANGR